jgi:hypothetical protein
LIYLFHVKHSGKRARSGNRSTWNRRDLRPKWLKFQIGPTSEIAKSLLDFGEKTQKFSTIQRGLGGAGTHRFKSQEVYILHGVASHSLSAALGAFHSLARFSTVQAPILKSAFPLV